MSLIFHANGQLPLPYSYSCAATLSDHSSGYTAVYYKYTATYRHKQNVALGSRCSQKGGEDLSLPMAHPSPYPIPRTLYDFPFLTSSKSLLNPVSKP